MVFTINEVMTFIVLPFFYKTEKITLDIENYKLDILNYKLDIENYKLDILKYKLDILNYKLDILNYKLDILNHKLSLKYQRFTPYGCLELENFEFMPKTYFFLHSFLPQFFHLVQPFFDLRTRHYTWIYIKHILG